MTKKINSYLNYLAFDMSKPEVKPISENGPLFLLPGQDSFDSIGAF